MFQPQFSFYNKRSKRRSRRKGKSQIDVMTALKHKEEDMEIENDLKNKVTVGIEKNGKDDEALINAVNNYLLADIQRILNDAAQTFSQEALNRSLLVAAKNGQKLPLILLLKSGAEVNCADNDGNTALMSCARSSFIDLAKILITNKADVNKVNIAGDTALILSIKQYGAADMARLLVSEENVNLKNLEGYTALMRAIEVCDLDTIKLLIMNGANVNEKGKEETVLEMANRRGILKFVNVFTECFSLRHPTLNAAVKLRDLSLIKIILTYEKDCLNSMYYSGKLALETFLDYLISNKIELTLEDKNIIKLLIASDKNIKANLKPRGQYPYKENLLVKAVQLGDLDIVKWFYVSGAQINGGQQFGSFTPLKMAARLGYIDIVKYLISRNADSEASGVEGTALDLAIKHQHFDCSKFLLEEKAVQKGVHETCKIAIESKQLCLLEHICTKFCFWLNDISYMDYAIEAECVDIIKFLITKGTNINECISKKPPSSYVFIKTPSMICPLHLAIKKGNLEIVQVLLHEKAEIDIRDSNEETPLFHACAEARDDIVELLLLCGCNVNAKNNVGRTALFCAVETERTDIIKHLLASKADVNVCDDLNETPMLTAIKKRNPDIVSLLINCNADINFRFKGGKSYLMQLLNYHHYREEFERILQLFLTNNIDINLQDDNGNTAFILACKSSNLSTVNLLFEINADINIINKETKSALSISLECDFNITRELLLKNAKFNTVVACQQAAHVFITNNKLELLSLAIGQGIYPFSLKSDNNIHLLFKHTFVQGQYISPLSLALHEQKLSLAKYLIQIRFLTKYDVCDLVSTPLFQNNILKLQLDSIFNNVLSLYTLCFVKISDMLGAAPDREIKAFELPLPQQIKQHLMFRDLKVELDDF